MALEGDTPRKLNVAWQSSHSPEETARLNNAARATANGNISFELLKRLDATKSPSHETESAYEKFDAMVEFLIKLRVHEPETFDIEKIDAAKAVLLSRKSLEDVMKIVRKGNPHAWREQPERAYAAAAILADVYDDMPAEVKGKLPYGSLPARNAYRRNFSTL